MATSLFYNFVSLSDDDGTLTVGFSDAQFETQEYLRFQKSATADEDEESDGVYVERDGEHQSAHGGIEKFVLSRDKAFLTLRARTAESLNLDQDVVITFKATDEQFEQLKKEFGRVFAGEVDFQVK